MQPVPAKGQDIFTKESNFASVSLPVLASASDAKTLTLQHIVCCKASYLNNSQFTSSSGPSSSTCRTTIRNRHQTYMYEDLPPPDLASPLAMPSPVHPSLGTEEKMWNGWEEQDRTVQGHLPSLCVLILVLLQQCKFLGPRFRQETSTKA